MDRYGVDSVSKVKSIKDRAAASFCTKSEDEKKAIVEKSKATKLERYGDENYRDVSKFKETLSKFSKAKKRQILKKRKQTTESKYGCSNVS